MRFWRCFLFLPLISACGTLSGDKSAEQNTEPTLASLHARGTTVVRADLANIAPDAAISRYEKLLNESNQAATRAEALRRLADLTLRHAEVRMVAESDQKTDALSPAQKTATFEHAIDLYKQLLQEFPNYPERAAVHYQLAKAYDFLAERSASQDALATIARDFPQNPRIAEVQFRRGEAMFIERKWAEADQAYSAVVAGGEGSGFYRQALYKRGWTRFKLARYENALNDYFPLLEYLRAHDVKDKQTEDLYGDTFRVIALSFSYLDGPRSLSEWFESHGRRDYEPETYQALATLYIQQERYRDAADTYQAFVDHNRMHDQAPAFETAIIETYQKGKFPSLVLPAKEAFAEHYGRNSAYWKQARSTALSTLLPQLKIHLKDVAQHFHALAQQSKKAPDYLLAARWYREYIDTFPQQLETAGMHFLMAEALYDADAMADAAQEFELVAYNYLPHEKSEQAGYEAMVSYQLLIQRFDDAQKKLPATGTAAVKHPWRTPAIGAGRKYVEHFGQQAHAPGVLISVINWLIAENDLPAAVAGSRQLLLLAQANESQRRDARIIIANGEFDLQHFAEAEVAYTDVLTIGGLDAKTIASFRERRAIAVYRQGELALKGGDKRAAIAQYLRLAQVEPTATVRASAEYDAAALLLELEDWSAAIAVLEKFRQQFSGNTLAAGVAEKLAFAYEKNSQWGRAATEYLRISNSTKDAALEREALWHSAELFEKATDRDNALAAYRNYLTRFSAPYAPAQYARLAMLRLYVAANDIEKRDFWRRELIKAHAQEKGDKPAVITYQVAQAAFELADPNIIAFEKVPLKLPLNKSIKAKREVMQVALKAYESITQYAVAEFTVAANFRIGDMYRQLAYDLMHSERPKGMDQDALDEYDVLLEEQSSPFEDKALSIFEANLAYTEQGIYNRWIDKTLATLAKMNPSRYGKTEDVDKVYQ